MYDELALVKTPNIIVTLKTDNSKDSYATGRNASIYV